MSDENQKSGPPPGQKTPADFPIWQSTLAEQIGVSIDDFREQRDQLLTEGEDWRFDGMHRVILTEEAAQRLVAYFLEEKAKPAHALPPGLLRADEVRACVIRSFPNLTNPRVLEAVLTTDGQAHKTGAVITVRVRNNRAWRRGDELTARLFQGQLYDITSKAPKRKV